MIRAAPHFSGDWVGCKVQAGQRSTQVTVSPGQGARMDLIMRRACVGVQEHDSKNSRLSMERAVNGKS